MKILIKEHQPKYGYLMSPKRIDIDGTMFDNEPRFCWLVLVLGKNQWGGKDHVYER